MGGGLSKQELEELQRQTEELARKLLEEERKKQGGSDE
jgi:hypothetical protein